MDTTEKSEKSEKPSLSTESRQPSPKTVKTEEISVEESKEASPSQKSGEPKKNGCANWFKKNLLLILTLTAVALGVGVGLLLRNGDLAKQTIRFIGFPGVLFMNMLKMMVLPLIITSLITGLAQIGGRNMGRMIGIAFSLYIITMLMAVGTGIALVLIIHPGDASYSGKAAGELHIQTGGVTSLDTVMDMIRNLFPPNLFQALLKQQMSKYVIHEVFNETSNSTVIVKKHTVEYVNGSNVLGLITICMGVGICLSNMGRKKNRVVVEFLSIFETIVTKLIRLIMWYSPVGIVCFIIEKILQIQDLWGVLAMMSKFIATVSIAIAIHSFITLPLFYFALTRKNPFKIIKGMTPACLVAFACSGSAAAMPTSMFCVEENLKVPKKISKFVVAVGSTVNMNGTALYESVACIFIAQLSGMELTIGQVLTVSLTSTLAGIATVSVPHAGLVTLIMVLASIGLPATEIQLIFTIDWLLNRLRATLNVLGDGFMADIVWHYIEKQENKQRADGTYKSDTGSNEDTGP